ncbi:MAG TPA: hypothetical protein VGV85_17300 [Longimicrobiaceae bacterium]|nr:hypothetical protein [Longimicrobiaceae bacterium]
MPEHTPRVWNRDDVRTVMQFVNAHVYVDGALSLMRFVERFPRADGRSLEQILAEWEEMESPEDLATRVTEALTNQFPGASIATVVEDARADSDDPADWILAAVRVVLAANAGVSHG